MAAHIKSSGDIESIISSPDITAGDTASLVFRTWDDVSPPFMIKVKDPTGKTVVDRVLRELPTGRPQSSPPLSFTTTQPGAYNIHIRELYGKVEGEAVLTIP